MCAPTSILARRWRTGVPRLHTSVATEAADPPTRGLERRNESEYEACHDRHCRCEEQDAQVRRQIQRQR